jgi:hypothetical protein
MTAALTSTVGARLDIVAAARTGGKGRSCELAEYIAQVPSDLPKQQLLAVLWCEHDMVLALPCRVVQVIKVGIEIERAPL